LLQSLLKANGFEAVTARDGNQALELLKKTLSTSSFPICACRRWTE
jgi:CheY-like chemotaxis protein